MEKTKTIVTRPFWPNRNKFIRMKLIPFTWDQTVFMATNLKLFLDANRNHYSLQFLFLFQTRWTKLKSSYCHWNRERWLSIKFYFSNKTEAVNVHFVSLRKLFRKKWNIASSGFKQTIPEIKIKTYPIWKDTNTYKK